MIEQYLSNTNEIATVLILSKILELNKALFWYFGMEGVICSNSKERNRARTLVDPGLDILIVQTLANKVGHLS